MHFAHYVYLENSVVNNLKQVRPPDFYLNSIKFKFNIKLNLNFICIFGMLQSEENWEQRTLAVLVLYTHKLNLLVKTIIRGRTFPPTGFDTKFTD